MACARGLFRFHPTSLPRLTCNCSCLGPDLQFKHLLLEIAIPFIAILKLYNCNFTNAINSNEIPKCNSKNRTIAIPFIAILKFYNCNFTNATNSNAIPKCNSKNRTIAIPCIAIMRFSNCIPEWHFWELQLIIAISFFQNCTNTI